MDDRGDGAPSADLGFSWTRRKDGDIAIIRGGRTVTIVRGAAAAALSSKLSTNEPAIVQQVLARATGNYPRGNERLAGKHPRNR